MHRKEPDELNHFSFEEPVVPFSASSCLCSEAVALLSALDDRGQVWRPKSGPKVFAARGALDLYTCLGHQLSLAAARLQAVCRPKEYLDLDLKGKLLPLWHALEEAHTCGYQLQICYRGPRMLCQCGSRKHIVLRGTHPTLKKPWTSVAEPYPRGFCCVVAGSLCSDRMVSQTQCCGCSKTGSLRAGEAKNPGPRPFREPRNLSSEHMLQQLAASVALGDRSWNSFYNWAAESLHAHDSLQVFLEVPLFLAHANRRYGDLQFSSRGALHAYYPDLVLAAQRRVPNLRQFAHVWWELAGRWELAEPVKHCTLVPLPILQGMVSLAVMLGWKSWAGVSLVCFFGVVRVGEVC